MLGIVENLRELRTILLGQRLRIYTDNKKLKCNFLNNYRVLRWILMIEYYGPDIEYTQGDKNILAYAL